MFDMELELSVRGWCSCDAVLRDGAIKWRTLYPIEKVQREKLKFKICATPSVTRMCDTLKKSALEEICEMV